MQKKIAITLWVPPCKTLSKMNTNAKVFLPIHCKMAALSGFSKIWLECISFDQCFLAVQAPGICFNYCAYYSQKATKQWQIHVIQTLTLRWTTRWKCYPVIFGIFIIPILNWLLPKFYEKESHFLKLIFKLSPNFYYVAKFYVLTTVGS